MLEYPAVLIVDDDNIQRLLMKTILEKSGIVASCAQNGEEALRKIASQTFSHMITDLNMPSMSGLELARKVKTVAPAIRIALCSGEDISNLSNVATDTGIEAVFTKPVDYCTILELVIGKVSMTADCS